MEVMSYLVRDLRSLSALVLLYVKYIEKRGMSARGENLYMEKKTAGSAPS